MPYSAKMDTAALLAKLIKLSNSNTQFEFKITSFLNIISWELDLEHAVLLTLVNDQKQLQPLWLADSIFPRLGPVACPGDNIIGRCLTGRQTLLADQDDLRGLPRDWAAFVAPFSEGLMVTPLIDDKTGYGVLLLLRRTFRPLEPNQALLMEAVANELTIAIKNVKLATDTRKRISVLNVLSDLGRTLSSTIDVEEVMTIIPQIASGIFLADGCTINILDEDAHCLILSSQYGLIPPAYNFERYRYAHQLPASVAEALSRPASFSGFLKEDPCAMDLSDAEMMNTIISCPLIFQGRHQGSISLFNKLGGQGGQSDPPRLFDRDDLELLFSMNNMISGVLENAITFREVESLAHTNEKIVSYLSILYEISSAMMTTVRYDELVWIITRALTDRQGLGFDQVLILLLEEDEKGRPSTLVSSAFWTYGQSDEEAVPYEGLAELLKKISKEEAARMIQRGGDMRVRIPVFTENPRLLSRVVLEKKAMMGFRAFESERDEQLKSFGLKAYAAVPMVAKNRDVGVIAVDRYFSGDPLTLSDLRDLTMLANQAGLAIENARLYDDLEKANRTLSQVRGRLIDAEKAAAQGEMGTHLAHEVRNPLVSIGGFTQRLLKKMPEDDPLRKYAEVIWEEVSRVNKVLNNILDYSRNTEGLMREFQLEVKVAEAIDTLRHEMERLNITLELTADPDLPPVSADDSQVMHVVLNIIYNAFRAIEPKAGRIHIRLFETREADESYVACEITDTGPGIPPEILPNIFTPFYTSKIDGTGLGLSIVKKIVDRYHGRIQVSNYPAHIPDSGASFTFMFPAVQSGAFKISSAGQE